MSLKTLQNNISAIQERKKFDIASIMAAQTAQQNQETIGKFIKIPKNSNPRIFFSKFLDRKLNSKNSNTRLGSDENQSGEENSAESPEIIRRELSERGSSPLSNSLPVSNAAQLTAEHTNRTLLELLAAQQAAFLRLQSSSLQTSPLLSVFNAQNALASASANIALASSLNSSRTVTEAPSIPTVNPVRKPSSSPPTVSTPPTSTHGPLVPVSTAACSTPGTAESAPTTISAISPLSGASYLPGQPASFPPGIQNIKDLLLLQQSQQLQQAQQLQQLQQIQVLEQCHF